jgi:hypothetical protein
MATNRNGNFAEGRVCDRGRERYRPRGEVGRVFRQAFAVRNSAQAAMLELVDEIKKLYPGWPDEWQ